MIVNGKSVAATLLKLLAASLAVGLVLSFLGLTPLDILEDLSGTVRQLVETAINVMRWAADYILLGAVIVVPIWLLVRLFSKITGKRG